MHIGYQINHFLNGSPFSFYCHGNSLKKDSQIRQARNQYNSRNYDDPKSMYFPLSACMRYCSHSLACFCRSYGLFDCLNCMITSKKLPFIKLHHEAKMLARKGIFARSSMTQHREAVRGRSPKACIISFMIKNFRVLRLGNFLVPVVGVEPTRYRYHWILSPARLPIPSYRRTDILYHTFFIKSSLFFIFPKIFHFFQPFREFCIYC